MDIYISEEDKGHFGADTTITLTLTMGQLYIWLTTPQGSIFRKIPPPPGKNMKGEVKKGEFVKEKGRKGREKGRKEKDKEKGGSKQVK